MNIFKKRPLSLILCIMMGGFSLFTFVPYIFKISIFCIGLISLLALVLFPIIKKKKIPIICIVSFLVSALFSSIFFEYIFFPNNYGNEYVDIEAKVITLEQEDDFTKIIFSVETVNDDKAFDKRMITWYYGDVTELSSGDKITFQGKIVILDEEYEKETRTYYVSNGISATVTVKNQITKVEDGRPYLESIFTDFRRSLGDKIVKSVGNNEGSLFVALLFGDTDRMSPEFKNEFRSLGLTHILAVSGMHLTILCGALTKLLSIFKIDKRLILGIALVFCVFFMLITGMPSSIVRAGLMFIISTLLYLFVGCRDGITNLFIAATLILAFQPFAVYDIGFWLSAIATFGILLASGLIGRKYVKSSRPRKLIKGLVFSFYYSLFAVVATIGISSLVFGTVSVLSIPTTIVFSVITEIYLYAGLILLPICSFLPAVKSIMSVMMEGMCNLSSLLCEIPLIYNSARFPATLLLSILTTVLLFGFCIIKTKHKKTFVSIFAILLISVYSLSIILTAALKNSDTVIYSSNSGDRFLINSQNETTLVDYSGYDTNDIYSAISFVNDNKLTEIDNYMVFNYSYWLDNNIDKIILKLSPKKILLPLPNEPDEDIISTEIYMKTINYGIELVFYEENQVLSFGKIKMSMISRMRISEGKACSVAFFYEDKVYGYLSRGAMFGGNEPEELLYISSSLIFGGYGDEKSYDTVIYSITDKLTVINNNSKDVKFSKGLDLSDIKIFTQSKNYTFIKR